MSMLGEAVLSGLVKMRPSATPTHQSEGAGYRRYIARQYESSRGYFAKFPRFDVRGKSVLEIGCGTGGRAAYLATRGARRVVGADINANEIEIAKRLVSELYPTTLGTLEFHVSRENEALDVGQFDVVVLADVMEHVVSPAKMMRLAYNYTAPGGTFFFSVLGFFHYAGSHIDLLPFANLLFSDETILNVVRAQVSRPDYVPDRFDSDPPIDRWRGLYDLRDRPGEHLNKITLREIKKLVRYSPFQSSHMSVVGFGHKHPLLKLTDVLRRVPVLQEVYHSIVIVDCLK